MKRLKKYLQTYFFLLLGIFFAVCLWSYNTYDPTIISYTFPVIPCTNWGGIAGAHCAALIIYFFGGAGFVISLFFLWISQLYYRQKIKEKGEQFFAWCCLIISLSFLFSLHDFDLIGGCVPGGVIGIVTVNYSNYFFGPIGSLICAYSFFVASIIIFSQQFCMGFIRSMNERIENFIIKQKSEKWKIEPLTIMNTKEIEQSTHHSIIQEKQGDFTLPSLDLLQNENQEKIITSSHELQQKARILEEKLTCFGLKGSVIHIKQGPVVTLFEYEPSMQTKLSKIIALEDDLALALHATSLRVIAPIAGTNRVGFEVSNNLRTTVSFTTLFRNSSHSFQQSLLPLVLGVDTSGDPYIGDLAKMPHVLVAGSTGSGKSITLHAMITGLLYKYGPESLKLILIDPKRLEFSSYQEIPHLIFPIIYEAPKAISALHWVVQEMERRYQQLSQCGLRNHSLSQFPYLVVVIDELADLMLTAAKEIEQLLVRITQMARAAGIHLIVATQRPSVDIITGLIKVNIPSRIALRVLSKIDSRTILDSVGAEKLLGKGDMLVIDGQRPGLVRVHGAFITDTDRQRVISFLTQQQKPMYQELIPVCEQQNEVSLEDQQLFETIVAYIQSVDEVSISLLQRRFKIGYNRSARMIELLESKGYITSTSLGKMRKVIRA